MAGRPIKREEAADSRLEVRINKELKEAFRDYCKAHNVTVADKITELIKTTLNQEA